MPGVVDRRIHVRNVTAKSILKNLASSNGISRSHRALVSTHPNNAWNAELHPPIGRVGRGSGRGGDGRFLEPIPFACKSALPARSSRPSWKGWKEGEIPWNATAVCDDVTFGCSESSLGGPFADRTVFQGQPSLLAKVTSTQSATGGLAMAARFTLIDSCLVHVGRDTAKSGGGKFGESF